MLTHVPLLRGSIGAIWMPSGSVFRYPVIRRKRFVKGRNDLLAWKIDLAKAYDKLQWSFIKLVLEEVGIGDPLYPYTFVLCMEKLSHIIHQKFLDGDWKPVKISINGPRISHLFFTDNLILFGQASLHQAAFMREALDLFCDISGQQISFSKSRVHCSNNISHGLAKALAAVCGSPITQNLGNYLGVPLIHVRVTKGTYNEIIEKTHKRLAAWKCASLSFISRCTLIKSVTFVLPTYVMQSIKLPMEGSNSDKRKIHLVKWDTVCLPKKLGGLGIRKMKLMNQSLLAKIGWRLYQLGRSN
ncbi:hypothetical protein Ddye_024115 [Dipteronia dyeriana]|uniref:Reverse transcriptase domain-containing protein n=1 Tax=Dipteronia dyeriana TaxID=168575 RepID=A0AAD9TU99_9ROSI|nr:hypothetical protein Ddye_024115 [Dipteronia dyeriana]